MQLVLPPLVGTREAVVELLNEQHIPGSLDGTELEVIGRTVSSVSQSFADELVHEILDTRGADRIVLIASRGRLEDRVRKAAENRGLAERVKLESSTSA